MMQYAGPEKYIRNQQRKKKKKKRRALNIIIKQVVVVMVWEQGSLGVACTSFTDQQKIWPQRVICEAIGVPRHIGHCTSSFVLSTTCSTSFQSGRTLGSAAATL